jgi:predicted HicB family RNase H-like nuclease
MKTVQSVIDEALHAKLVKTAAREQRSLSQVIARILGKAYAPKEKKQ